jgi:endo-1,4-beta-xylanase
MISRRTVLGGLPSTALAASSSAVRAAMLRPSILGDGSESLRTLAAQRGLLYGSAACTYQLRDRDFAAALSREAGILVPEYEMKRDAIERSRGQFDFSACDALIEFAHARAMSIRGHTLVWYHSNPDWLEEAVLDWHDSGLLTSYVTSVVSHFRGRIGSWDVVNEAIAPGDGRKDGLRESFWLKAFGPSYIDEAYHTARAADPDALLVYNDWGCEAGEPANDRFRAVTLSFLEAALARGVPIQALGLQGHLAAFGPQVDQRKLSRFLDDVDSLGLRILVTEHDVDDSGGPSDVGERDRKVADSSRRFLDVILPHRATAAVLTWGLSDRFLDTPGWRQRLAGYTPRKLPLDSDLGRKPMWQALAASLANV